MAHKYLVIVFAVLAVVLTALPEASAHGRPIQRIIENRPARQLLGDAAVGIWRGARAVVAVPACVLNRSAGFFLDLQPARKSLRAIGGAGQRLAERIRCNRERRIHRRNFH